MNIEEKVRKAIADESKREQTSDYQNLREFYEAKKREGVALKPEYSLPPLDTVGHSLRLASRSEDK